MERRHESEHSMEIPVEILQDILLRLPIKDAVRSSCVSKLWCRIVRDPSFGKLHAANHAHDLAAASESEPLLVSLNREPGRGDEVSLFNLASGNAMCHVAVPGGYTLANVCNGFLCFALNDYDQAPVVVCNPVTGETLEIPKAPQLSTSKEENGGGGVTHLSHRFVLGFSSPPTQEYKVFRLSCPQYCSTRGHKTNHIAVYTLGGRHGWRQYSYLSQFCPLHTLPPPVHIDGDLYIPVETGRIYIPDLPARQERAARMMVLNVATETRRVYRLPYNFNHHGYHEAWAEMLADGFELNGQMCLAVTVLHGVRCRRELQFWVMKPPGELVGGKDDDDELHWDLRYCFDLSGDSTIRAPSGAWLDHDKMLCYRHGDVLYKHDTSGGCSLSSNDGLLLFDQKSELPQAPSVPPSPVVSSQLASLLPSCQWNIYGVTDPACSPLSPLHCHRPRT